jgi:hypothetical protein
MSSTPSCPGSLIPATTLRSPCPLVSCLRASACCASDRATTIHCSPARFHPHSPSFSLFSLDQPLSPGLLPASLLYLSLSWGKAESRQLLVKGSLPASLEWLSLWNWSQTLEEGLLPPRLKGLHLGAFTEQLHPHILPSSLRYLSLGSFNQRLLVDVLPSSLVELRLGSWYDQSLPPGALPPSLRRLTLGKRFRQRLQVGSLPEGLMFLRFEPDGRLRWTPLPPILLGVLPSTLLGIDFSNRYHHPLAAGIVPSAVRWIRLSSSYCHGRVEAVLPAHAECRWYSEDDETEWQILEACNSSSTVSSVL